MKNSLVQNCEKLSRRSFGVMFVESVMSNYNGDPDMGNQPRTTKGDDCGLISPVAFKHRVRDMLDDHRGPLWNYLNTELDLNEDNFYIWESAYKGFCDASTPKAANDLAKAYLKKNGESAICDRYWDIRAFGTTALEGKGDKSKKHDDSVMNFKRSGCVAVSPFQSLRPVEIISQTITKANPLRPELAENGDGDIAPLAFKVARHALFVGWYVINPHKAHYTNTTEKDIEVFKKLVVHAANNSISAFRSGVRMVRVIHATHENPLCSFNESEFFNFCRPVALTKEGVPSTSMADYELKSQKDITDKFPNVKIEFLL